MQPNEVTYDNVTFLKVKMYLILKHINISFMFCNKCLACVKCPLHDLERMFSAKWKRKSSSPVNVDSSQISGSRLLRLRRTRMFHYKEQI